MSILLTKFLLKGLKYLKFRLYLLFLLWNNTSQSIVFFNSIYFIVFKFNILATTKNIILIQPEINFKALTYIGQSVALRDEVIIAIADKE